MSAALPDGPQREQAVRARYAKRRRWPFAGVGYRVVTALGWVVGAALSTGRIDRHDGLWVFRGIPHRLIARAGVSVGGCYLTARATAPEVLRHERIHREQWRHYGLALPVLYALAGSDPSHNRFEVEAGLSDGGYLHDGM